ACSSATRPNHRRGLPRRRLSLTSWPAYAAGYGHRQRAVSQLSVSCYKAWSSTSMFCGLTRRARCLSTGLRPQSADRPHIRDGLGRNARNSDLNPPDTLAVLLDLARIRLRNARPDIRSGLETGLAFSPCAMNPARRPFERGIRERHSRGRRQLVEIPEIIVLPTE